MYKNGGRLKSHHHVLLDKKFKFDCEVWRLFLTHFRENSLCLPMVDFNVMLKAEDIGFASDTSANKILGFGAIFRNRWLFGQWEQGYIENCKPSIEYLELYAVTAALLTWGDQITNMRVIIKCDNTSMVEMINKSSSSCRNCMYLICLIILNNLVNNRRVFAQHLRGIFNELPDALSRLQFKCFWRLAPASMNKLPSTVSPLV